MKILSSEFLAKLESAPEKKTVMVGFDGYIDSILRVRKEAGEQGNQYFTSLAEFGAYIQSKAHKSCSLELNLQTEKIGGNMPIFAQALSAMQFNLHCIGAMGYPKVNPLFSPLEKSCKLVSVCEPGQCQALEFHDGKMMLARNQDIEKMDFDLIRERAGMEMLWSLVEESDLLAFLNWSELQGSTTIWKGFLKEVFPPISLKGKKLFIDLSDCSHRSNKDILEMVGLLREFSEILEITLSLNLNESERLAGALNIPKAGVQDIAHELYAAIGCHTLLVHLVDCCYCVKHQKIMTQKNRYIEKPLFSTGGGDNFNAGFVYAQLNNFSPEDSMTIANAFSGFYISHGISPNRESLAAWLKEEVH